MIVAAGMPSVTAGRPRIDGVTNAVVCRARPVGEVTVIGPGAGPELAGQGVLSDVIAVARRRAGRC